MSAAAGAQKYKRCSGSSKPQALRCGGTAVYCKIMLKKHESSFLKEEF
jgi:hypothetical protein